MFQPGQCVEVHLKKQVIFLNSYVVTYESCCTTQDSAVNVIVPPGEHGEVSKRLSSVIAHIRNKPVHRDVYRDETRSYVDPSGLLASIQAKSVPTCDVLVKGCIQICKNDIEEKFSLII